MKLRNAHLAVIDRGNILDYLLNETHPENGGKARFFGLLGYSREDPEPLMQALREVAEHGEVVSSAESAHGQKYVVDGASRLARNWLASAARASAERANAALRMSAALRFMALILAVTESVRRRPRAT